MEVSNEQEDTVCSRIGQRNTDMVETLPHPSTDATQSPAKSQLASCGAGQADSKAHLEIHGGLE